MVVLLGMKQWSTTDTVSPLPFNFKEGLYLQVFPEQSAIVFSAVLYCIYDVSLSSFCKCFWNWDGHENWSDPRPNQYK